MAEDLQDAGSTRIANIIPHFYYDLLGRILPGAYLIAGLVLVFWNRPELMAARCYLRESALTKSEGANLFLFVTVGFLLFLSLTYITGLVFGSISFLVEKIWKKLAPFDLHELLDSSGCTLEQELQIKAAFRDQFHFALDEKKGLQESSSLCSYYVWASAPNLGTMTSRWDAETLASRSLFTASLALILIQVANSHLGDSPIRSVPPIIIFAAFGLAAAFQYGFQRRKQIQGRFALFQAFRSTKEQAAIASVQSATPGSPVGDSGPGNLASPDRKSN